MPTLDLPIELIDLSSPAMCDCPPTSLCDRCHEEHWLRHRGTVACRGETFVETHRRAPTLAEARAAVVDLARDPELVARLAGEWMRWAEMRLEKWRSDAGDWLRRT